MLELKNVDAYYGDSQVLHAIGLRLENGGRLAVLGRNGAGKSTLLKSIMNAGPKVRGEVRYKGRSLEGLAPYQRTRAGMTLVPEDRRIFTHLSTLENIRFGGASAGRSFSAAQAEEVLQRIPMLVPLRDRLGGLMSGGQQQMLALARGLAASPGLMLLDEPTEGLAPVIVEQMALDINAACHDSGMGLLLCEQHIAFARRCTERVVVLSTGRLVFEGSWAEFDQNPAIKQQYLAV